MPRRTKPGLDWFEIERAYRTGEPVRSIARRHGCSDTAIRKMAAKRTWTVCEATANLPRELIVTETARAAAAPRNGYQARQVALGSATPANAQRVLAALRSGASFRTAAHLAGMHERTFEEWRKRDPDFDVACRHAMAETASELEGAIVSQGKSGDTRAARDWLAAQERGSWASLDGGKGGGLTVNFTFNRDAAPPVIDVTPEETGVSD